MAAMKGLVLAVAVLSLLSSVLGDQQSASSPTFPHGVTTPDRDPLDYRLTFHEPSGCKPEECTMFIGIDTNEGNSSYLDIYMNGKSRGWVAVGFTKTPNMFSTDVIACNINPNESKVELLDAYNVPAPRFHNDIDEIQQSYLFSATDENGRISCTCGRAINGTGANVSFDLDSDYFTILGRAIKDPRPGSLVPHVIASPNPVVFKPMVNPARTVNGSSGSDVGEFERICIQIHGIFMIVSWSILVTLGIFFAAHMKSALPNGWWFQIHRGLMVAALVFGVVGFILIFVAQKDNPTPGLIHLGTVGALIRVRTAHFSIGILVMFLQLINPTIALFRCKPGSRNRWIYNYVHGTGIGMAALILAYANMGTGLTIFSTGFSRWSDLTLLWVFIGYVALLTVVDTAAYLYTRLCKRCNGAYDTLINAEKTGLLGNEGGKSSESSVYLWALFVLHTIVTVGCSVALIVLVALPLPQ